MGKMRPYHRELTVYRGVVRGNVVVLPDEVHLPDGTLVEVSFAPTEQVHLDEAGRETLALQHMVDRGMVEPRRGRATGNEADPWAGFEPIDVKGRPLSEDIIRDRR